MNGVSEDERFAVSEEVEGGEAAVEFPSEASCVAVVSDDGVQVDQGEHGLEIGLENFRAVEDAGVIEGEVDDLSGDGVRGIEVLDVESACGGEWSVGFVLADDLAGDGGSVIGATDGDGDHMSRRGCAGFTMPLGDRANRLRSLCKVDRKFEAVNR